MPIGLHQKFNELNAPQNAPIGVRTAPVPTTPSTYGQAPYVFIGDGTGGQVPRNGGQAFPQLHFPSMAPDGTDIAYSGAAAPAFRDYIFGPMAQRAAERNNQLQGLFGGTPYQPPQDPLMIRYTADEYFSQQQAAFDDLSRWLMQQQLNPVPNMRAYRGSSFGGGADWQNQFKDF